MNVQKILKAISTKEITATQKAALKHFEKGRPTTQMNMIAFD